MALTLVQDVIEFAFEHQAGPVTAPLHVHHFCQLDVILGGEMYLHTRRTRTLLVRGSGTIIPPLAIHGFAGAGSVRHATFKMRVHPHYSMLLGREPRVVSFDEQHMALAERAGVMWQSGAKWRVQTVYATAALCLIHACGPGEPSGSAEQRLEAPAEAIWPVLDEVIRQPHAGWTVRLMARRAHLSEGYFSKQFLRWFGQSPRRFLLETRIWRAADELNRGAVSVKAAAELAGYATVHSFTRAFKRATGFSPAAYVKSQGRL